MQCHCRNLARIDLYFLLRYALRREDAERQWVLDRCREVQESPSGRLDLWAREHYKSTIVTFAKSIQDILRTHGDDPLEPRECTIGIFAYNRPAAKKFLRQIKQELEGNLVLKEWFPDILWSDPRKEATKWSEDEGLVVKRSGNPKEATVEAWGLVDGMPTGSHFTHRIYDDVVTERSVTEGMLKKTTLAWELSTNLGVEGGVERYIGTRYHDGDTYGVILERGVAIPRIHPATEDGSAAGKPVLVSEGYLEERRARMSPYNFACQWLLDPLPAEDAYFSEEMVRWYDSNTPPQHVTKYGASDYATTHGAGDWTVHGVVGLDPVGDIYILDWYRAQVGTDVWVDAQCDLILKHKPLKWAVEKGVLEKSVGPFLKRRMRESQAWCHLEPFTSAADKATRAQSIRGRASMGKLYLPRNAPWTQDLVNEILRFPLGVHDDQVDTLSLIGRMLDRMHEAKAPVVKERREPDDSFSRHKKKMHAARRPRRTRMGLSSRNGFYNG